MINCLKIRFEPCYVLVNQTYSWYNDNILCNQDLFGQIENDEVREALYSNNQDNENTESVPNFIARIMAGDDVLESITSLNSK